MATTATDKHKCKKKSVVNFNCSKFEMQFKSLIFASWFLTYTCSAFLVNGLKSHDLKRSKVAPSVGRRQIKDRVLKLPQQMTKADFQKLVEKATKLARRIRYDRCMCVFKANAICKGYISFYVCSFIIESCV